MKTNKRFLALCLALLLVCAVLPAPAVQGADVQLSLIHISEPTRP